MEHKDGDLIDPGPGNKSKVVFLEEHYYWVLSNGKLERSLLDSTSFTGDPVVCNIFDVLAKVLYGNEQ